MSTHIANAICLLELTTTRIAAIILTAAKRFAPRQASEGVKAMNKAFKPGQRAPLSGQYAVVGPRGGNSGKEITAVKGGTLPPSPKPGSTYVPVDPTRNKSGRP